MDNIDNTLRSIKDHLRDMTPTPFRAAYSSDKIRADWEMFKKSGQYPNTRERYKLSPRAKI